MADDTEVKTFLIKAIQNAEETIDSEIVDSEELIINMALVNLFTAFEIGVALDHEEVISLRKKLQDDIKEVKKAIKEGVVYFG